MPTRAQYKSLILNIIKNIGVIFLNASVFTIGMMSGCMLWLMFASGHHYLIDYGAMLTGFILTFKTNQEMYEATRYPKNDIQDAPSIPWGTQFRFIKTIATSSLIIIPAKVLANTILSTAD